MKTFEEFLLERALSTKPSDFKVGDYVEGGSYLGEFQGHEYIVAPISTEDSFIWKEAIEYSKNLEVDGYKDWFLPNKEELNFAYEQYKNNKDKLEFTEGWHWSSDIIDVKSANKVGLAGGTLSFDKKERELAVRAFRRL